MTRLLKDASGIYNLEWVASLHPVPIKGDKNDQSKVTAVLTAISTTGGQTHQTTIPWEAASAIALEFWSGGAAPFVAAPPVAPVAPPTDAENLATAKEQFGG